MGSWCEFPKGRPGCWGRTGMNIKHCASFLEHRTRWERQQEEEAWRDPKKQERNSFFKLIPSLKFSFPTWILHEEDSGTTSMAVREHLPARSRSLHHSFHTHSTLMLTIKMGSLWVIKEVCLRLVNQRESNKVWQHQGWESYPEATYLVICNDVSVQQLAKTQSHSSSLSLLK